MQEAKLAFDKGEYGRAGELFERIAEKAAARNGPRAPAFYWKAGQARILAGQTSLGMPSLKRGLELLAQRGQFRQLYAFGMCVVSESSERGSQRQASERETWLKTALPSAASFDVPQKRPVLPNPYPSFGAGVRPDEVGWLEDVTAECAYCGSPIR